MDYFARHRYVNVSYHLISSYKFDLMAGVRKLCLMLIQFDFSIIYIHIQIHLIVISVLAHLAELPTCAAGKVMGSSPMETCVHQIIDKMVLYLV